MKRRDFLTGALAAGGAYQGFAQEPEDRAATIKRVLVAFMCHFDAGFIDTQAAVVRKYFDVFFPRAMQIAARMRADGDDRYIWTTGSWLLYEYLDRGDATNRARMEKAVDAGDIAWHALPFNWQTALMDQSMISGALGISHTLDRRFGRTTAGAKMSDVPGHTRGLIAPLVENGVTFLDIGVNSASTPPNVPALFRWKNAAGQALVMMYHHQAYGGVVRVPASDLAVAVEVRNDNSGPHSITEIKNIYAELKARFPEARVSAATMTDIANAVAPFAHRLPVVTEEIGDTWIYGVPSDPVKVARYREMLRLRRGWIAAGRFKAADAVDIALLRRLALAAEHTWGTDTKTWLDFDHYTPRDLAAMIDEPKYKTVEKSWVEKRNDIDEGVASLPPDLRQHAKTRLAALEPVRPSTSGRKPHIPDDTIDTEHFQLALDPATGAIRTLRRKETGRDWASSEHPLALFAYQTLSKHDYDRFLASYVTSKADWAPKDFGKPNIEHFGAISRTWVPTLKRCWISENAREQRVMSELAIHDAASERDGLVAWPQTMYLEVILPANEPALYINFSWFDKTANRLPEAMWLSFFPHAPEVRNWVLDKTNESVSPFDVVPGGNRRMHALIGGLQYKDAHGAFGIESLDAPVVALGERSPIYFSKMQPNMAKGLHFSLFNNGWGTNYIQWFGENMRFRFKITA